MEKMVKKIKMKKMRIKKKKAKNKATELLILLISVKTHVFSPKLSILVKIDEFF